eukprot:augustus_masked-scaffold_101-processed-gene-0.11-mRNA-1 protein AED:1.00 eAED:1.00 QI:0/0/0/0/1/1/3/0/669
MVHMLAAVSNFRKNQEMTFRQLVVHRKKNPLQVLKYNTPTLFSRSTEGLNTTAVQFMADRGMALIRGDFPKPNLSANEDPDRPRRITPFGSVTKGEPAVGASMWALNCKVRPSENTRKDAEDRLQKRIDTLTMANERIKAQSLAAESVLRDRNATIMKKVVDEERKKNKADLKRMAKELKDVKKLYRAEVEKVRELQRSSSPAHGRTLSDFAETRSFAGATQDSDYTLSAKMSGVESNLTKLTEVTAQALKKSKDTDEVAEIKRQKAEDARRDRAWRSYGGKFKTLKSLKVKDIRAMLDMRDAYLNVYNSEKEPNLWIKVDPELKQSFSSSGVTKEGFVDYLRKYMSEHEVYKGEDTLRTIAEKVTWPSEGPFLERLNAYISSGTGCIKWKQLKENAQKFEVLKALNKRVPIQLQLRDGRLKVKLDPPKSKFGDSLNKFKELIKSVYERKMNTPEEVDLTPPEPVNIAPRASEVRRAHQRTRRGVYRSCFADSVAVVRVLMSEELRQLSVVYNIVVVELNLKLILGSISNFAEYGYTRAEMVKGIDEFAEGELVVKSYFAFIKNLNTQKLHRQKSMNVQFLTGLRLPRLRIAAMIRKLTGGKMEILDNVPSISTASIDFSRRLRDVNAEGIPFGETIHLKQNKDVVDEDNLEQLMLPEKRALSTGGGKG